MTFKLSLVFIVAIFAASCSKECVEGDGKLAAEIRPLESFDKIANSSTYDIFINKGETFEGSVQGDSNIVANTQLNVGGSELEINPGNICGSTLSLRVDIVVPSLTKIVNDGTGNIRGTTDFINLEIENSGTGDITLSGQSLDEMNIENDGTGSILMFDLGAKSLVVDNTGTGDVFVFVSEKLDVTITGTGNVYYRGRPEITSDITGIGQLIDDN